LISREDMTAYRVITREPLRGEYRGHEIVTMPPPSSGGIALLQMAAMLEPFDVAALGHHSATKYHLFAEVMRRAFRDRAEYPGDPDFVQVPVARLLDREYAKRRMADFDPHRATASRDLGPGLGPVALPAESTETTHFSVTDAAGNAVSNTYTINGGYGSGVTIPGVGVLMNNEMDDFTTAAGRPNVYGLIQGSANAIAPGKRPLSSMTPTMVFKEGKPVLVTGSPGGPTIINTVLQVISNVIDHGMPVAQAVEAPRIHHQWMPDVLTYERYGMSADTATALRARGHQLKERASYEGAYQGDAATIAINPHTGVQHGAADPRRPDARAVGF
jgi:gamma-glutamyltranspeptidase/glutathione hydrolase